MRYPGYRAELALELRTSFDTIDLLDSGAEVITLASPRPAWPDRRSSDRDGSMAWVAGCSARMIVDQLAADVRVIAAANVDLRDRVEKNSFAATCSIA